MKISDISKGMNITDPPIISFFFVLWNVQEHSYIILQVIEGLQKLFHELLNGPK